jgi:uncharacterized surface protein with fasciclin (FAS1) repeats
MRKVPLRVAAGLLGLTLVAAACGGDDADSESSAGTVATTAAGAATTEATSAKTTEAAATEKDIVDTAVDAGSFKTLATALTEAGLVETLKGDGPFTVFAPTDDAFAKLPAGTLDGLLKDKAELTKVLTYHVVAGEVLAADVVKLTSAKTVEGSDIAIKVDGGAVTLNGNVKVTTTDIKASNGVIHVIDAVLIPGQAAEEAAPAAKDIVDTAVGAGNFKTLATALTSAGLVETLKGPGPFTVFAPTDDAFAKLPPGTVETLLANKEELTKILTYHVVPGSVTADKVVTLTSANTVQGGPVTIEVKDGSVILNGNVKVTTTDVKASNGVIHVIDGVLLPA